MAQQQQQQQSGASSENYIKMLLASAWKNRRRHTWHVQRRASPRVQVENKNDAAAEEYRHVRLSLWKTTTPRHGKEEWPSDESRNDISNRDMKGRDGGGSKPFDAVVPDISFLSTPIRRNPPPAPKYNTTPVHRRNPHYDNTAPFSPIRNAMNLSIDTTLATDGDADLNDPRGRRLRCDEWLQTPIRRAVPPSPGPGYEADVEPSPFKQQQREDESPSPACVKEPAWTTAHLVPALVVVRTPVKSSKAAPNEEEDGVSPLSSVGKEETLCEI